MLSHQFAGVNVNVNISVVLVCLWLKTGPMCIRTMFGAVGLSYCGFICYTNIALECTCTLFDENLNRTSF